MNKNPPHNNPSEIASPDNSESERAPKTRVNLQRSRAFQTGLSAESRAASFLVTKGFRIIARRCRTPVGEVDIVALRGNLMIFVEVKARDKLDDAAYAITPKQQQRIIAAAEFWLGQHRGHEKMDMRFDAILIAPGTAPRHIINAFDASP